MLRESGLQELEERVLGFLCTNSGSLKLLSTLDDAQRLLQQVPAHGLLSLTLMPVMDCCVQHTLRDVPPQYSRV